MTNKTRKEAVAYLDKILDGDLTVIRKEGGCWHWGKQEFRAFLDYLYDGPPQSQDEELGSAREPEPPKSLFLPSLPDWY